MNNKQKSFWSTPTGWAALGLIGAASYFLLVEHQQHFFEYLPFLILLLCPLMHVFMHGSHGHGDHKGHEEEASAPKEPETFQELTDKNEAYRDGYLEGLKTGREESIKTESDNER
tara:strand:- start:1106 stop:1450 length:345 start_codon:yes stop_codon:yes gene_type:complete